MRRFMFPTVLSSLLTVYLLYIPVQARRGRLDNDTTEHAIRSTEILRGLVNTKTSAAVRLAMISRNDKNILFPKISKARNIPKKRSALGKTRNPLTYLAKGNPMDRTM